METAKSLPERRKQRQAKTKARHRSMPKYDIVIDGYNVGTDYNQGKTFRVERIQRALEYFENIGKRPVAIISKPMSMDYSPLLNLSKQGRVILAGKQDNHRRNPWYHEYNVIDFARKREIQIVSNNMYRKSSPFFGEDFGKELYEKYLIPYTFIKRRFLPNPSSKNLADGTRYTTRPDHKKKKKQM